MSGKGRGIYHPEERPATGDQQKDPRDNMDIDTGGENRSSIDLACDIRPPEGVIEDIEDGVTDDRREQAPGPVGQQPQ